jgi:hypothetical protein
MSAEPVPLGATPKENGTRDAVHIAIISVECADARIKPGKNVGLLEDGRASAEVEPGKIIGIVDPFLNRMVWRGDNFWLCLYPNADRGTHGRI